MHFLHDGNNCVLLGIQMDVHVYRENSILFFRISLSVHEMNINYGHFHLSAFDRKFREMSNDVLLGVRV